MVVDPDGPPCVCGRRGCWERYASGSGLAQLARAAAVGGRLRRVVEVAGGDAGMVRGEHVQAAAREGDPRAVAVVDEFARWVALGLVNLTNVLDPATVRARRGTGRGGGPLPRPDPAMVHRAALRAGAASAPGPGVRRARRAGGRDRRGDVRRAASERHSNVSPPGRGTMAETRGDPRTEGRAALRNAWRAPCSTPASGVAIVVAVVTVLAGRRSIRRRRTAPAAEFVCDALGLVALGDVVVRHRRRRAGAALATRPAMGADAPRPEPGGARAADRGPRRRGAGAARRDQGRRQARRPVAARRRPRHLRPPGDVRRRPAARVRERRGTVSPGSLLVVALLVVLGVLPARGGLAHVADQSGGRAASPRSSAQQYRLHDADVSLRRAAAIPPVDVTSSRAVEPGEHPADHRRRQLVRRPAATDPVPAPVRQCAGHGAVPRRTVAGVRLRPPAAHRHLGHAPTSWRSRGGRVR